MSALPGSRPFPELYVPHLGWFVHEPEDAVALYLNQGWFEYREQAFAWLYLREGDTVLDCGAHFGLYSVLAGHAIGSGRVLAVEANPATVPVLQRNLEAHRTPGACAIARAVAAENGESRFYPAAPGRAAYSSLIPEDEAQEAVAVAATTLDQLLDEQGVARADFAKIDVEGAEIDVLRGAARSLAEGRLPLVMIECSEANLRRAGRDTRALFAQFEASACPVWSFDPDQMRLVPRACEGPIWYENLFLTREPDAVNQRLRSAPEARRRLAAEILTRGRAADGLYRHVEEASQVVSQARQSEEEAYRRLGETNWRLEQTTGELRQEQRLLRELAAHLQPYLASRYVRLGWKLHVLHRPEWLMRFVSTRRESDNA